MRLSVLPLASIGSAAATALQRNCHGRVIAAFARCFYAQTSEGLLCIGLWSLGRGPLNVLLDSSYQYLPFTVQAGDPIHWVGSTMRVSDHVSLETAGADDYAGPVSFPWPARKALYRNRCSLAEIHTLHDLPLDGLAFLLGNADTDTDTDTDTAADGSALARQSELQIGLRTGLRRATLPSLHALANWLRSAIDSGSDSGSDSDLQPAIQGNCRLHAEQHAEQHEERRAECGLQAALQGLLGAGPGLTPSGDDLLAGVMLALHRVDRADLAEILWCTMSPMLTRCTNVISAAYLEQAAQGHTSEAMCRLLDSLFAEELICLRSLPGELDAMGSTSGWDTLAGVTLVIDAWLDVQDACTLDLAACTPRHTGSRALELPVAQA